MKIIKKLAIYLDDVVAQLIEFSDDANKKLSIYSEFSIQDKDKILDGTEREMVNMKQHTQKAYFKLMFLPILDFDEVLLFGPTNAKIALLHFLRQDRKFENINFELLPTEKLTELQQQQQHDFVWEYFHYN